MFVHTGQSFFLYTTSLQYQWHNQKDGPNYPAFLNSEASKLTKTSPSNKHPLPRKTLLPLRHTNELLHTSIRPQTARSTRALSRIYYGLPHKAMGRVPGYGGWYLRPDDPRGCPLPLVLGCQTQPHFPPHVFLKRKLCVWSISSRGLSFFFRRHLSCKSLLKPMQYMYVLSIFNSWQYIYIPILLGPKCVWVWRTLHTQCSLLWPCLCPPRRKLRACSGQRRHAIGRVYLERRQTPNSKWHVSGEMGYFESSSAQGVVLLLRMVCICMCMCMWTLLDVDYCTAKYLAKFQILPV